MSSPIKRPQSADSHTFMMENIPNNYIIESTIYSPTTTISPYHLNHHTNNNNNNNNNYYHNNNNNHHPYTTSVTINQNNHHLLSSPSQPKKSRTRTLRTKLKKKAAWPR